MPIRLKVSALALLLLTTACAGSTAARAEVGTVAPEMEARAARASSDGQMPAQDRLLVRRAELVLEARAPESLAGGVEETARAAGGYVESSVVSEGRLRVTMRVPAAQLDATLAQLGRMGEVERQQVSTHDVTEQVFDMEARLANLRAVRDRLRQYLDRATQVGDIIQVERELTRVQGEIEALEGRLNRMRTETSMSHITLEVRQKRVLGPLGQLLAGLGWLVGKLFVIQ